MFSESFCYLGDFLKISSDNFDETIQIALNFLELWLFRKVRKKKFEICDFLKKHEI